MTQDDKLLLIQNLNDLKADANKLGNYLVFDNNELAAASVKEIKLLDEIIERAQTIKDLLTQ